MDACKVKIFEVSTRLCRRRDSLGKGCTAGLSPNPCTSECDDIWFGSEHIQARGDGDGDGDARTTDKAFEIDICTVFTEGRVG